MMDGCSKREVDFPTYKRTEFFVCGIEADVEGRSG